MPDQTVRPAELRREAAAMTEEIIRWRRYLHAHPELSFQEKNSTAFIAETLRSFGIKNVRTGFADLDVGVLAEIGPPRGPCVLLRADMDALPVPDQTGLSCASTNPGISHACGHDAHMAILLATAKLLKAHENELPGRVRLIFQPAEESSMPYQGTLRPGAWFVIKDGALDGVGAAFSLHVFGTMKAGTMNIKEGTAMLASGFFNAKVTGQGTHGATPHLGIDPIVPAAAMIGDFQAIIAREVNPLRSAVLSICTIHAGTASNVIPEFCEFSGTLRSEECELVSYLSDRLQTVAHKTAEAYRCNFSYHATLSDAVINEPGVTAIAREAGSAVIGKENVLEAEPLTVSEDFTLYGQKIPASMFFWGMGDETKGIGQSQHDPTYLVNEETLSDAAAVMVVCAWKWLKKHSS